MRDFVIVTIALLLFLGIGIATGMLIVAVLPRRRRPGDPEGSQREESPTPPTDVKPPWYDR